MMTKRAYPLRIPSGLLELADLKSAEERTERAIALRQWLYLGAEDYVLQLLARGRISISRAAEFLELSIYDVHQICQERGVAIGATVEQFDRSMEVADALPWKREDD